ncbi:MAG: copper resistance protein CopC [Candidatus Binatia bacterium]|nr:copper resistance protein CopC [Candidatus Binatia bacterium]
MSRQATVSAIAGVLFASVPTLSLRPNVCWAHARLLRSEPVNREVLRSSPPMIRLWFNELLDRGFHSIEVFVASELKAKRRRNLASGSPEVNPDDRTELRVRIPELSPGEYVVEYRVLSRDGHSAPGRITFEIRAPEEP